MATRCAFASAAGALVAVHTVKARIRPRSTLNIKKLLSSPARDAGIVLDTLQRDAAAALARHFPGAQMPGKHVPHRCALLLVDGGPSGHLVTPARLDGAAVI